MPETELGEHTIEVSLLLLMALLLSSTLFNSKAWRNFTQKDFAQLQSLQLRLLEHLVGALSFISNSIIFLELGVLPIKYEIHKRQLSFLHHIVSMSANDPVCMLYESMKRLPFEQNWFKDILISAADYSIDIAEQKLKWLSKDTFKS